jgi:hypothetical protein
MQHLPDPANLGLAPFPDSVLAVRVPVDGLTVFRLVNSVPATDEDFVPYTAKLRSGGMPIVLTNSISVWLSTQSALNVRRRSTSRIAELRLVPDPFTHVARTNRIREGDHVSVWAPKRRLLRAVIRYW